MTFIANDHMLDLSEILIEVDIVEYVHQVVRAKNVKSASENKPTNTALHGHHETKSTMDYGFKAKLEYLNL